MMRRLAPYLTRRRRGAVSIETMLVFPALLVLFAAVPQVLALAQAKSYAEMAAYAAARSAQVHLCPPVQIRVLLPSRYSKPIPYSCTDNRQKIEDAARWTLVAASSTSPMSRSCPTIRAGHQMIMGMNQVNKYSEAVETAICYAFESGNVTVDANWVLTAQALDPQRKTLPVTATVTFRFPLTTPFRKFIPGKVQRGDGSYYVEGSATVELL